MTKLLTLIKLRLKMEKTKEALMKECWSNYQKSKDIRYLIRAVDNAPFFGQAAMAEEISKLLLKIREKEQ